MRATAESCDSETWPCWPLLPIRRGEELGLFVADRGPTVYVANIVDVEKGSGDLDTDLATFPKHEYESFDAALADGWVVD